MNARVRAALALAKRALPVLPLWWTSPSGVCACDAEPSKCKKPGKHPLGRLVRHGVKDATLDPRTIATWWRRFPKANIGIACGGAMRLLVVDVDPDKSGEASLAALERQQGPLPETVEVVTPRGGRHVYLIVSQGRSLPTISAGKLGPGLDHRCQGATSLRRPQRSAASLTRGPSTAPNSSPRRPHGCSICSKPPAPVTVGSRRRRSGSRWSPPASKKDSATRLLLASPGCFSGACPSRPSLPSWSPAGTG